MAPSILGRLLASWLTIASPPLDGDTPTPAPEPSRFQPRPSDPRASVYSPRESLWFDSVFPSLRVRNHLVRVFGLERPHLYGLDLQLGASFFFINDEVGVSLEPQTGYAFVHHRDFDGHAWLTSVGVCAFPYADPIFGVCYEPSFVFGTEAGERSRGLRHGLALEVFHVALEAQHGVTWLGPNVARHELRGCLSVDVLPLIWISVEVISLASGF